MVEMLLLLFAAHALGDYPLQGDYMAKAKNRHTEEGGEIWPWILFAHASIHAGFVYWLTGSMILGLLELVIHAVVDYLKCEKKISFHTDQAIHYSCKIAWAIIAVYVVHTN